MFDVPGRNCGVLLDIAAMASFITSNYIDKRKWIIKQQISNFSEVETF